jgi:hypothetical protein
MIAINQNNSIRLLILYKLSLFLVFFSLRERDVYGLLKTLFGALKKINKKTPGCTMLRLKAAKGGAPIPPHFC